MTAAKIHIRIDNNINWSLTQHTSLYLVKLLKKQTSTTGLPQQLGICNVRPHNMILGNIRGVINFNVEVMNNTEHIRHQSTTQKNKQAFCTIGDLQTKMDKLI